MKKLVVKIGGAALIALMLIVGVFTAQNASAKTLSESTRAQRGTFYIYAEKGEKVSFNFVSDKTKWGPTAIACAPSAKLTLRAPTGTDPVYSKDERLKTNAYGSEIGEVKNRGLATFNGEYSSDVSGVWKLDYEPDNPDFSFKGSTCKKDNNRDLSATWSINVKNAAKGNVKGRVFITQPILSGGQETFTYVIANNQGFKYRVEGSTQGIKDFTSNHNGQTNPYYVFVDGQIDENMPATLPGYSLNVPEPNAKELVEKFSSRNGGGFGVSPEVRGTSKINGKLLLTGLDIDKKPNGWTKEFLAENGKEFVFKENHKNSVGIKAELLETGTAYFDPSFSKVTPLNGESSFQSVAKAESNLSKVFHKWDIASYTKNQPKPKVEQSIEVMPDCKNNVVKAVTTTKTTPYKWDDEKEWWVLGESTAKSNEETMEIPEGSDGWSMFCPMPVDKVEASEWKDSTDKNAKDFENKTVKQTRTVTTTSHKWDNTNMKWVPSDPVTTTEERTRPMTDEEIKAGTAVPEAKTEASPWVDSTDKDAKNFKDKTVKQTRTLTTIPWKWDSDKHEYVPDPDKKTVKTEERTRPMTDEEIKAGTAVPEAKAGTDTPAPVKKAALPQTGTRIVGLVSGFALLVAAGVAFRAYKKREDED